MEQQRAREDVPDLLPGAMREMSSSSDNEQMEEPTFSKNEETVSRAQRKRLRRKKLKAANAERAGRFVGPLLDGQSPPARQQSEVHKLTDVEDTTNMSKSKRRKLAKRSKQEKEAREFTAEQVNGELVIKPC